MKTNIRHSWIRIGHGNKECTACGMKAISEKASDKYNTIWTYYTRNGNVLDKVKGCININDF